MKRLFYVRDTHTTKRNKKAKPIMYFDNKQEAKALRKSLNGIDKEGNEKLGRYTIALGVDHWRYK